MPGKVPAKILTHRADFEFPQNYFIILTMIYTDGPGFAVW